jgi:hypothetical protein
MDPLLLPALYEAIRLGNTREIDRIARLITSSDYPIPLKEQARRLAGTSRYRPESPADAATYNLHRVAKEAYRNSYSFEQASWLPLSIIKDAIKDQQNAINTPQAANKQDHYPPPGHELESNGISPIRHARSIKAKTVALAIQDYFDVELYKASHPELINADEQAILFHYANHRGDSRQSNPNHLLSNQDFYDLYPWVIEARINPLYIYIRWPIEFPGITRIILNRYAAKIESSRLPWQRSIVRVNARPLSSSDWNGRRIRALTSEHSSHSRRTAPNSNCMTIHFVTTSRSGDGERNRAMTQLVADLESYGHQCTVWIKDSNQYAPDDIPSPQDRKQTPQRKSIPLSTHFAFANGDALVATSEDTLDLVVSHQSFHEKFYLIHDYEGTLCQHQVSLKSPINDSYNNRLKRIYAQPWDQAKIPEQFRLSSTNFSPCHTCITSSLSPTKQSIRPTSQPDNVLRIAFYTESSSDPNTVQLVMAGLGLIHPDEHQIVLECFGATSNLDGIPANISGIDNGMLSLEQSAKLYKSCDLGISLSTSLYGLTAKEMMAGGLAVITIDNERTRWIYPDDVHVRVKPSSQAIADAVRTIASNPLLRSGYVFRAHQWISSIEKSQPVKQIEAYIRNELSKKPAKTNYPSSRIRVFRSLPHTFQIKSPTRGSRATVILLSQNGGKQIKECARSILDQSCNFSHNLLILDSGSIDGSIADLPKDSRLSVVNISNEHCNRGSIVNLGIALARSPYIVFLDQDSLPFNKAWLRNLIAPLEENKSVVLAYGRHKNRSGSLSMSRINTADDFAMTDTIQTGEQTGISDCQEKARRQFQRFLEFSSITNYCIRKEAWESYPCPDIERGSHTLWIDWLSQTGCTAAHAPKAITVSDNNTSSADAYKRAEIDSYVFSKYFGLTPFHDRLSTEKSIEAMAAQIKKANLASDKHEVSRKLIQLRAEHEGHLRGAIRYQNELAFN